MSGLWASVKKGSVPPVSLAGMQPQIVFAAFVTFGVLIARGIPCVFTSFNDGQHGKNSLHYAGRAFDLRLPSRFTNDKATDQSIKTELKDALGQEFDVVLEGDHFHVEWDPKENA